VVWFGAGYVSHDTACRAEADGRQGVALIAMAAVHGGVAGIKKIVLKILAFAESVTKITFTTNKNLASADDTKSCLDFPVRRNCGVLRRETPGGFFR